jgi:putative FmdB family regulatory protein
MPAKADFQVGPEGWIPASAGMTNRVDPGAFVQSRREAHHGFIGRTSGAFTGQIPQGEEVLGRLPTLGNLLDDTLWQESLMPIYEYRCRKCGKSFSVLTLRVSETPSPQCDKCGSRAADRLMSRFATPKSEEARMESLADPSNLGGLDENDPKSVSRWMRKMGKEMGDDLGGEDFDEMMDEVEGGEGGEGDDDL